jgi:hypothetical protein
MKQLGPKIKDSVVSKTRYGLAMDIGLQSFLAKVSHFWNYV